MASMITLLFELLLTLLLLQTTVAAHRSNVLHPHCQEFCGKERIPYPFGIGDGCYKESYGDFYNESFRIKCDPSTTVPIFGENLPISDISLLDSQATINVNVTYDCYNASGLRSNQSYYLDLESTPFAVSAALNKFTAIGCSTIVFIEGTRNTYMSGCMSFCDEIPYDNFGNGSCTGTGCCQTSLPKNFNNYEFYLAHRSGDSVTWKFNPCSYAFVADQNWFKFNTSYLKKENFKKQWLSSAPLVLDWVVDTMTCVEAEKQTSYACRSNNSYCINSTSGLQGYTCKCSQGYEGNPYLEDGCQDIDECSRSRPCPEGNICKNKAGNYNCSCPQGYQSEDPMQKKCALIPPPPPPPPSTSNKLTLWVTLALGVSIGTVLLLVSSFCIYIEREKRKLGKEKERFFQKNGGLLLYEEIKSKDSRRGPLFKIFEKEEMEKATNNFDNNLVLGCGGRGTVYKGILDGNITVAIKKSRMIDESQKEEFVKEILIVSQINHKNVVKLVGCCLEVEVPMLVYEFVSNGTLHDYIHGKNHLQFIPLDLRLRIAIESAEALAYLHSSASPPILHGDVKSSNILLDENNVPKVSDFGASTLVALDETQFATIIQGTCGYLDPEYLQTHIITEKSDVYSFGVILLELLTRKKVFWFDESKTEKSLASTFLSLLNEGRQMEVFDTQLSNGGQVDGGQMEVLLEVSYLAKQCLSMKGEERPTMKEVVEGLQRLRKFSRHPWEHHNSEEVEILLGDSSSYSIKDATGYHSLANRAVLSIEGGR